MRKEQTLMMLLAMLLFVILLGVLPLMGRGSEPESIVALPMVMVEIERQYPSQAGSTTTEPGTPEPAESTPGLEPTPAVTEQPTATEPPCEVSSKYPDTVFRWCALITKYGNEFGVDPDLVAALIFIESNGRPNAISSSGAVGLMQVMPSDGAASRFMCVNGPCFAGRPSTKKLKDPEFNIMYGTRMLARLIKKHGLRDGLKEYGPMNYGYRYADLVLSKYEKYRK